MRTGGDTVVAGVVCVCVGWTGLYSGTALDVKRCARLSTGVDGCVAERRAKSKIAEGWVVLGRKDSQR